MDTEGSLGLINTMVIHIVKQCDIYTWKIVHIGGTRAIAGQSTVKNKACIFWLVNIGYLIFYDATHGFVVGLAYSSVYPHSLQKQYPRVQTGFLS